MSKEILILCGIFLTISMSCHIYSLILPLSKKEQKGLEELEKYFSDMYGR